MEYEPTQRCAFTPCTNSFSKLNHKKKYCSGCCRVKDFNRRKKQQEFISSIPAVRKEVKVLQEPTALASLPLVKCQAEETNEPKKGMTLAGVGESAVGTAGMLLLKDQLFDKSHRNQLQQQIHHLLKQQAQISHQLQEVNRKMDMLSKGNLDSSWAEKLLM